MRDNISTPQFGKPPLGYDYQFFDSLTRILTLHLQDQLAVGPVRVATLNISNLPTSATGLRSGDIWNDGGTLKVVT